MGWDRKPRILLLSDTNNWAWWIKSQNLKRFLSDEFDFDIVALLHNHGPIKYNDYDLAATYGWSYVNNIMKVPFERRVSGVTAHKDDKFMKSMVVPQLKKCKWVHANSIMLRNTLNEYGFKEVFYVPNGVDEVLFYEKKSISEKRDNLVVGHVGKACQAGSDSKGQKNYIEPACRKAGVEYKGHYSNYRNSTPHKQMPDFYNNLDAGIVASNTDGTPNMLLECSACARPVISNRIGNSPEFIVDGVNGFLLDKRDVDLYTEKLLYLKNNRDKLIEMGKAARKTIEEGWTWKIQAENYRKMFQDILRGVGLLK
jgi:glycosyltransferase involved in cell wall biosynthesis